MHTQQESDRPRWTSVWWRSRRGRWLAAIVASVAMYGVVAGFVVPRIARGLVEQRLTRVLGGPVSIAALRFHPFALRAQMQGFSLAEPDGSPCLAWSNVIADLQVASLWRGEVFLRLLAIDHPALDVRRSRDGRINLVELGRRLSAPGTNVAAGPSTESESTNLFPVTIGQIQLTGGVLRFADEAVAGGFRAEIHSAGLWVSNLTTRAGGRGTWNFEVSGDSGERVEGAGWLELSPVRADGLVQGSGIPVAKPTPYISEVSPLRPTHGVLAFSIPWRAAIGASGVAVDLRDGRVSVSQLAMIESEGGEPFAEAREVQLEGLSLSLAAREASLGAIRLDGANLRVRRMPGVKSDERPRTNLRGLIAPEVVEAVVANLTDWRFRLGRATLEGSRVEWEDRTLEPPTRLHLGGIGILVSDITNESNAPPSVVEASMQWCDHGTIRLNAEGSMLPASVQAKLGLEDLELRPLSPYVAQFVQLDIGSGSLAAGIEARYGRSSDPAAPLVSVSGDLAVNQLAAVEAGSGTDFIRWDAIEFQGLQAGLEPNRVRLDELVVRRLQTSLVLLTNGQLNVLELIRRAQGAAANATNTPAPAEAVVDANPVDDRSSQESASADGPFWKTWPASLGKLRLEQVGIYAADRYIAGDFQTSVESLDGEVRGLALPAERPAEIDLKGRLTAVSGFEITGTMNPDPAAFAADLKLSTHRADLVQFAPYTLRFASYPVTKGELTADVHYRVEGSSLQAENRFELDQFTLGPKTPHPEAVDLPLKLGVALLKDTEGRIRLDLPLTGSLGDPQFRLAPILWQAVRNVLVKAATAPFRLLGSLLGGGGDEDLEVVEFEPGAAQMATGQTNRLGRLVQALAKRPDLQIEVVPEFHVKLDRHAIAMQRLDARLQSLRIEEIGASGAPLPESGRVVLTADDRVRLVAKAYQRDFGVLPTNAPQIVTPTVTNAIPEGGNSPGVVAHPRPETDAPADALAQATDRLLSLIDVPPESLMTLARHRAQSVADFLTGVAGLETNRILIAAEPVDTPADARPRVRFRLE